MTSFSRPHDLSVQFGETHARAQLSARLDEARRAGWSLTSLNVSGRWGMAAAVFCTGARPIGAITLTGIEARFSPDRRPELGALLPKGAHHLSSVLQHPVRTRDDARERDPLETHIWASALGAFGDPDGDLGA